MGGRGPKVRAPLHFMSVVCSCRASVVFMAAGMLHGHRIFQTGCPIPQVMYLPVRLGFWIGMTRPSGLHLSTFAAGSLQALLLPVEQYMHGWPLLESGAPPSNHRQFAGRSGASCLVVRQGAVHKGDDGGGLIDTFPGTVLFLGGPLQGCGECDVVSQRFHYAHQRLHGPVRTVADQFL